MWSYPTSERDVLAPFSPSPSSRNSSKLLFFFAMQQGKLDYLLSLSEREWMHSDYCDLRDKAAGYGSDSLAFIAGEDLPQRYAKVATAYSAKKDAIKADRRVIGMMREKTLVALQDSDKTIYRLCKDLGLNLGNVYAYLNKGDVSKVSKDSARRIMAYAQEAYG